MRKSLAIILVVLILINGVGIIVNAAGYRKVTTKQETIKFSQPQVLEKNGYVEVEVAEATAKILEEGMPVLPVVTKVFKLPIGTEIQSISCSFSDIENVQLTSKICPAPKAVPLKAEYMQAVQPATENPEVYLDDALYPKGDYSFHTGVGLDSEKGRVMYLSVRCNPIKYSPLKNELFCARQVDISVQYVKPDVQTLGTSADGEEYDMVIIAPSKFVSALEPLVEHKNNHGIETFIATTEEIYGNYSGRDHAEQIKYFIKDAIENHNIRFVLLVGGRQGQTKNWYIPERVTHNDDGWEHGYASDLYYADVYKLQGNLLVFEDWDSNGNDVFAEFDDETGDVMDYYPDVYVGRFAVNYKAEIRNIVKKIIYYESGNCLPKWYKRMLLIAGDTFPNEEMYFEGEIETGLSASFIEPHGFKIIKLWASLETLNSSVNVTDAFRSGAGFVHFAGHGNPAVWSTHPPHAYDEWIDALYLRHMKQLRNRNKYPVVVVGGCHNSQFNVSVRNLIVHWIKYVKEYVREDGLINGIINGTKYFWGERFYYFEWVSRCWSQWLLSQPNGGSVGTIGMTSLGYGYVNEHTLDGLAGWLEPRFFHAVGIQGKPKLGIAHCQAITDYINIIGDVNTDRVDRKTIESWVLLGDPSLVFGGYSE